MTRTEIAIKILQGLMLRYKEVGYTDKDAIAESFRLADEFLVLATAIRQGEVVRGGKG